MNNRILVDFYETGLVEKESIFTHFKTRIEVVGMEPIDIKMETAHENAWGEYCGRTSVDKANEEAGEYIKNHPEEFNNVD